MADNAFKNIRSYRKYIFVALGIVIGGMALAVDLSASSEKGF